MLLFFSFIACRPEPTQVSRGVEPWISRCRTMKDELCAPDDVLLFDAPNKGCACVSRRGAHQKGHELGLEHYRVPRSLSQ